MKNAVTTLDLDELDAVVGGRSQGGACAMQVAGAAAAGGLAGFEWSGGNPAAGAAGAVGAGAYTFFSTASCNDGRQSYLEEAGSRWDE